VSLTSLGLCSWEWCQLSVSRQSKQRAIWKRILSIRNTASKQNTTQLACYKAKWMESPRCYLDCEISIFFNPHQAMKEVYLSPWILDFHFFSTWNSFFFCLASSQVVCHHSTAESHAHHRRQVIVFKSTAATSFMPHTNCIEI